MVRAEGCVPPTPDRGAWFEGNLDLAALARQLPQTLHLRDDLRVERGAARLRADVQSNAKGDIHVCNVTGKVTDLIAHQGQKTLTLPEPATLNAKIRKTGDDTTLERLEIQTRVPDRRRAGGSRSRHRRHGGGRSRRLPRAISRLDRSGGRRARRQGKVERFATGGKAKLLTRRRPPSSATYGSTGCR